MKTIDTFNMRCPKCDRAHSKTAEQHCLPDRFDWCDDCDRHVLIIVGCGKLKAPGPCKARDLYRGQLFKAASQYAERFGTRWLIASAKYGLLDPDDVVEPYDVTLKGAGRDARAAFRHRCQADYATYIGKHGQPQRVIILAGKDYVAPLIGEHGTALRKIKDTKLPLAGMGIGQRLSFFKTAAAS